MAELCPTCKEKPTPPGTYRGQCHAKTSPECEAWTDDFAFTVCNTCAEFMGTCRMCGQSLDAPVQIDVPTRKAFVRVNEHMNGAHIKGMDVGEQVLAQFTVDPYSWYTWELDRYASSPEVRYYGYRLVMNPRNYRQATLECYVDLVHSAEAAKLVFREVPMKNPWWERWGWQPPASTKKPLELTVEIRN